MVNRAFLKGFVLAKWEPPTLERRLMVYRGMTLDELVRNRFWDYLLELIGSDTVRTIVSFVIRMILRRYSL